MDNETNDNQQNSDNKSEMFELEKQLHQQYATNASANTGNFFAFLVSVLAVFYAFGYVYIFNTNEFACGDKLFSINNDHVEFTLDVLVYIASISIILLTFLICYCLELGWQQRRDHIIINGIRNRYFADEKKKVFGNSYLPENKGRWDFIPNQYKLFIVLFALLEALIVFSFLTKICICGLWMIFFIILSTVIVCKKGGDKYKKYEDLIKEIEESNKKEDNLQLKSEKKSINN